MTADRKTAKGKDTERADSPLRRELYFFCLFRLFESALLLFVAYSQFEFTTTRFEPNLTLRVGALVYVGLAVLLFMAGRDTRLGLRRQAAVGLG
ncbi:MAG: hypothetical protein KDI78_06360, partial [Xanthomonadales bacterium]|nr:hypothetical protein [Xanthomonadales bacterium]